MHNLQLTEDQSMVVETVQKYVEDAVMPTVLDQDEHRKFAQAEFEGLGELGLFGLPVPEDCGGVGMGLLSLAAVCEEVGAASGSLARLLSSQVQSALALGAAGGSALADVMTGEAVASYLGPEHGLTLAGGEIRGECELVTGAGAASVLVVAVVADGEPALCSVEAAQAGCRESRSLGFASAAPAHVSFSGVAAEPVAVGADATAAIASADLAGWIAGGGACIGMGRASVALAAKHASERIAFGKPLLKQQAVLHKLTEANRAVDAARHLVYHAARIADLGEDAVCSAMAARVTAAEAAVAAADEGIQIHGGFGYTVEYHVERHYRDAKTLEVLDGGNRGLRARLATAQFAD